MFVAENLIVGVGSEVVVRLRMTWICNCAEIISCYFLFISCCVQNLRMKIEKSAYHCHQGFVIFDEIVVFLFIERSEIVCVIFKKRTHVVC